MGSFGAFLNDREFVPQQGTAAERSHLRRLATGGGLLQLTAGGFYENPLRVKLSCDGNCQGAVLAQSSIRAGRVSGCPGGCSE